MRRVTKPTGGAKPPMSEKMPMKKGAGMAPPFTAGGAKRGKSKKRSAAFNRRLGDAC